MSQANLCNCPITTLTNIPDFECKESIGIISKLLFCREKLFQGATSPPTITTIKQLAEWAATMNAADGTKTVITPLIDNGKITPGDFLTAEFSQKTINTGQKPSMFEAVLLSAPKTTIAAIESLECEKNLYVYFINEAGQLIHAMYDTTKPGGFKVSSFSFGIKDTETDSNSANPDQNMIQFQLEAGWSSLKTITTGAFNYLELENGS